MSSAKSSLVPFESAGWVGVWPPASIEMRERSKSGKKALTYQKQSSKPSIKSRQAPLGGSQNHDIP